MDADLALLHEKIDRLTEQVEDQRSQQTAQITGNNGDELAHLHKKIDFISDQMEHAELNVLKRWTNLKTT